MSITGDLIRSRRKQRGLTQAQLGEKLGVSQVAVSEWETGRSHPANHMPGLQRELGIQPDELLATVLWEDEVVRAIWGQTRLPQDVRKALVTIYEQALKANEDMNYAMTITDE